ncbi:MAG TPA: LEA type 2 family protein [Casimicrobiaceae bacterium]
MRRLMLTTLKLIVALALAGCAGMEPREPLQVSVADIESLPGEGLEFRMKVSLRIQNPNDSPVDYVGVYVKLLVQDKTFATGVSDQHGSIGPYGESVISVPMTLSALRMAIYAVGMLDANPVDKIHYNLEGKLDGPAFGSTRFQAQGELALPGAATR